MVDTLKTWFFAWMENWFNAEQRIKDIGGMEFWNIG